MTNESERKQVRADEAAATVRNDDRLAALERERVIDLRAKADEDAAMPRLKPSLWERVKRYFTETRKHGG